MKEVTYISNANKKQIIEKKLAIRDVINWFCEHAHVKSSLA